VTKDKRAQFFNKDIPKRDTKIFVSVFICLCCWLFWKKYHKWKTSKQRTHYIW